MQIHINKDGQPLGPFSPAEVQAQLKSGALRLTDFAWRQGMAEWKPLSTLPEFAGVASTATVPPPVPQMYEPPPLKRGPLIAGAIVSGLLAAVFLLSVFYFFAVHEKDASLAPFFGLLFLTLVTASVMIQLIVILRHPPLGYCQVCEQPGPTMSVALNRHIGAVVLMFHKSLSGCLCKSCVRKTFWEYTLTTLGVGWWGFISFFITPVVLVNNFAVFVRSLFFKP